MPQFIGSFTPVTAGQTYASRWVNADIYSQISGSVFTDQGATLFIEQSGDANHADVSASYTVTASSGEGYLENLVLPYVRLRLTNTAGSNQTVLRLYNRFVLGNMP